MQMMIAFVGTMDRMLQYQKPNNIHRLPDDVLARCFRGVDQPDLARLALVCRRWHSVIRGSSAGTQVRNQNGPFTIHHAQS